MDIPDKLQRLLTPEHLDLIASVVDPARKGDLISIAAAAEKQVSNFLDRYLAEPQRAQDADAKTRKNARLNDKIQALERVLPKVDADVTRRQSHIDFLHALRGLRNVAAHGYGLRADDAAQLAQNPEMMKVTTDFPANAFAKLTELRDYLTTLRV